MKKYQLSDKVQNNVLSISNFRNRYFFRKDNSETCYKLDSHIDYMLSNGITEMDLYLAERKTDVPYFFCLHFEAVGDKSESDCGKFCKGYSPRNGKSGACKHYGYTYEQTDRCFILKILNK